MIFLQRTQLLRMGNLEFAEDGLGAAYRLRIILIGYDGRTRNSAILSILKCP